ncbi:MAG: apolipoprotein N-acyltransferase, partial [Omnitrophica WOR_2 bacterium RIFCSPLOWO2_02_FULL_45_28]
MVNLALWELIVVLGIKYQVSGIRRNFSFLVPFFCLLFSLAYGFYKLYRTPNHEPRTALEISVIQGNIPQELKWDKGSQALILDRYAQLSQKAALEKPDLIIWPEAASPGFIGVAEDDWLSEHIFAVAKETGIPLLLGSVVRENKNYFNSALLIDRQGRIAGRYDKLHLVPFGEYVPLKELFPFLETIVPVGDFTSGDSYT